MGTISWATPDHSANRVKKAGRRIRKGEATADDFGVLENWRRAHAFILNTFQTRLRNARKRFDGEVQVAQRHKRRPTIIDKLSREPTMQLSTMHDIAGCRAILDNLDDMLAFRETFLKSRSKHVHLNAESDQYDYIARPKASGYRGMHDVFQYKVEGSQGEKWNGLKVEVQFRTRVQHAWATAVETVDLLNGDRAKFGQANPRLQRFFQVTSEMLARVHETRNGPLPEVSDADLAQEFASLDGELGIVQRLTDAVATNPPLEKGKNTILIFHLAGDVALEVRHYDSIGPAQEAYSQLERDLESQADIVLVKAEHVDDLRRAFQNYFTDAGDFVTLVTQARNWLAE